MKKVLIVYFSWSNTSYKVAKVLYENTAESDIFQIEPAKKYPKSYSATVIQAGAEKLKKSRPNLVDKIKNMEMYETIILVYPNWWGTMPMPVWTFLEQYDFKEKLIVPICLNEGSGLGKSMNHIKRICSKAIVFEGIAISKSQADSSKTKDEIIDLLISV